MQNHFYSLETLSLADRSLFNRFSRGRSIEPSFSLIHQAFEKIVDIQPHSTAVDHDGRIMTYHELEEAANILANRLILQGLRLQQRVCLVVQRSNFMIIAILAVLKCGCQYVPLDGGVIPEKSLSHIFGDTEAPFILCLEKFLPTVLRVAHPNSCVISLDGADAADSCFDVTASRPHINFGSWNGAYIIYTSGTTGRPKGVDVTHQNVTNLVCLKPGSLSIRKGIAVAQLLSVSFDMSQWEIFATLLNGGTLLLRTHNWPKVLKLAHTIIATPSILGTLKSTDYPNIQVVALAGEPCPKPLADDWAQGRTFYNCCGPTEVTIVNTVHKYKPGEQLTIGQPVPNTNVYILDDCENPVPIGTKGFMWAGGRCVSRGYVNLREVTSKRFKVDKFLDDGSLMFNTGDIGRWQEDGTLEHLGRMDDQVKIKGYRVELDSVSAAIEVVLEWRAGRHAD